MNTKVSIQGYEGSFHQEAARQFFGKGVEVIPCATFREVVKIAVSKKESDGGVMAIENSIAGSILPNYNLLQKSNLRVVGEIYLQIKQNLLVNPGVTLKDIREVHSHPMAIQQCLEYLDKYDWKLIETEDTALSAEYPYDEKQLYKIFNYTKRRDRKESGERRQSIREFSYRSFTRKPGKSAHANCRRRY